ncbi:MAG: phosphotriesterase-related protein-like [Microbacteriaceae bacterium]|jgi:phosphotriesterase-related protein|nr:phosphotriesterase-related protein-like [Microbacteriaceae bacterium]
MTEYRIRTAHGFASFSESGGHALPHEHILVDSRVWWEGEGDWREFDSPEVLAATSNADLHRRPQGVTRENMILSDWYLAAKELLLARDHGTQLIVDLTVLGTGPNIEIAVRAADLAGIGIVVSAGRYLHNTLPERERMVDENELVDRWMSQIYESGPGELPGIIGEIGTSFDITDEEKTSIVAAGRVQHQTGLAMNIHVHPFAKRALSAIEIAVGAGADPRKIAISHLDCEIDVPQLIDILKTGAYVEMDNFGTSRSRIVNGDGYPDDSERIDLIGILVSEGYERQLLLSHDINHRNSLVANGGWGYAHIGSTIIPLLDDRFGQDLTRRLVSANPLEFLHLDRDREAAMTAASSPGRPAVA